MKTILSFDVGIRNLAFCIVRYDDLAVPTAEASPTQSEPAPDLDAARTRAKRRIVAGAEILDLCTIDTTDYMDDGVCTKRVSKIPLSAIARGVLRGLVARVGPALERAGGRVDHVVIENQPVMSNPTMKSVQMVVYTFFVQRFLDDPSVDLRMFQARNKLEIYTGEPVPCTLKTKYSRRKKLSIAYTHRLLSDRAAANRGCATTARAVANFEASKKKDDLADCYLQGLTFLYQQTVPSKVRAKKRPRKPAKAATTKTKTVVRVACP